MQRSVVATSALVLALWLQVCGAANAAVATHTGHGVASAPSIRAANPLKQMLAAGRQAAANHQHVMVIFDLDDTLFRTAPRSLAILKEWSATPAGQPYTAKVAALTLEQLGYGIDGALGEIGVPASQVPSIDKFWAARFFTSEYLKYDVANPGAVDFVKAVQRTGVQVVYMTGRSTDMQAGTQKALIDKGFPWDPAGLTTRLVVKPEKATPDYQFKGEQAKALAAEGTVIGSIDNEPRNVNTFHQVLPAAIVVELATVHSPNPPALLPGIYAVSSFESAQP
jgi:acid phosphatase class B